MEQICNSDHVLLFPFPANGHIKPFLSLAQLLCNGGLKVTFLNTDHNHRRTGNLRRRLSDQFGSLHFESISDGLPPDLPRNVLDRNFRVSMGQFTPPLFRELLMSYNNNNNNNINNNGITCWSRLPVSCVIMDVIMGFPYYDICEELGIRVYSFSTFSAGFLFLLFWIPNLLRDAQLPHPDGDINQELHGIPGAEGLILRCKDLPGDWSKESITKNNPMNFVNNTISSSRASGLIINTMDELESPFLKNLSKIYNKIYTIGPIHSLLINNTSPTETLKEDHHNNCLPWLDSQTPRSVVFVSFGTLAKITSLQLMELWNGLINSGKPFLLALLKSDDLVDNVNQMLETESMGKWLVLNWVPQEEVLKHEAIGAFLTHSGWNSVLESIAAGVPMISCPQIGDQLSNCIWVSKVWKIGFQMEDGFDRFTVETMVRSIMEHGNEDVKNRIGELAERVKICVGKDGMSNRNLNTLVEDIKKINLN